MNIYLLTQTQYVGYDTYDSAVVVAEDAADAATIHPSSWDGVRRLDASSETSYGSWPEDPSKVTTHLLGPYIGGAEGDEAHVVCASFNAG